MVITIAFLMCNAIKKSFCCFIYFLFFIALGKGKKTHPARYLDFFSATMEEVIQG